jgi:hypothetical protein
MLKRQDIQSSPLPHPRSANRGQSLVMILRWAESTIYVIFVKQFYGLRETYGIICGFIFLYLEYPEIDK